MSKKTDRKTEVAVMLRRAKGATAVQVCAKTGMLEHSARALISGIRRTLDDKVEELTTSKSGDGATVYKIVAVTKESKAA